MIVQFFKDHKPSLAIFLFLTVPGVWGAGSDLGDPHPIASPALNVGPIVSPTATPVGPSLIIAPTSAPSSADAPGIKSFQSKAAKGPGRWRSSMALGGVIPQSAGLQSNYPLGFSGSLGSGYQFSDKFSEWLIFDFDHFSPKGSQSIQYNVVELAFLSKLNVVGSVISPYLFMGPGVTYNEVRSNTSTGYDYYTGQFYFPINSYEVDFMAQGGVGLEWKLAETFRLFLQGKATFSFLSASFANNALADSLSVLFPIQIGVDMGL